ncbi:DUF808 domain-containing protein [Wohlfahrtiimonas populi]|uniref:DUF808 domain-containing protein n=1 Tax=Wohlfahrtiimonas populi TaxID=1940240 RepID=UPI00098D719D|nr:DUF808 domain-containing protein [Wohlfahrtiimonas populi]
MSPSLLALLDDITAVLDDVASMTKLATKKTAGVLTDDLAVNAQQVVGVQASREIPVVWSVAKGSFINKLLIIPAALLINAFAPWLMVVLLIIGGAYLCFEGAEKIHHTLFHKNSDKQKVLLNETGEVITDEMIQKMEKDKIKGAIRTDFILSAEIIVITLHTVANYSLTIQIMTLLSIAILITMGVYGLVAGIIKMDDLGYWMMKNAKAASLKAKTGLMLINAAPYLMKILGFIGTVAMFLVGGGIIIGEVPQLIALQNNWITMLNEYFFKHFVGIIYSFILGFIVGYIVLAGHAIYVKLFNKAH